MDESKQRVKDARAYQLIRQKLALLHLGLTPVLLLAVLLTPLNSFFLSAAGQGTYNGFVSVLIFFAFFSLFMLLFDGPLSFYSGYLLEHRFGLSNQTLLDWFSFLIKKSVLSFLLFSLLLTGLYALIWKFPDRWWLFAWAGYAGVSYLLGKIFPVWIVPLFYKYDRVTSDSLKARILALAKRYGLPLENVYSLNLSKTTRKANAAFMGLGKTKRVVLSDTLIDRFTEDEIETVVAHELGHFKNRDILRQLALGLVTSLVAFRLAALLLGPLGKVFGTGGAGDIASMPLLFLIFYLFSVVLMPLQSGFSRTRERAADLFALQAFPRKDVFISCMKKLAEVNLTDPEPHPVYEWFFHDHPSIGRRIRMAEAWNPA